MAYNNRFRRSLFGGFRRKDVLDCFEKFSEEKADELKNLNDQLEELRRQLTEKEETLNAEKEALIAEKDALAAERDALVAEREQANEQLETCKKALISQKEQLDSAVSAQEKAESESRASRQLLKERDVKIAFLEDKAQKLTLKMEASERKSRKYDALSVEIGEMMLEAKQSAESIIRQAEERSAKLTADAGHEVDRLSADLAQFLQQLNHIKTTMHSLTDGVETKLQSIEASVSSTQANITAFRKNTGNSTPSAPAVSASPTTKESVQVTPRAVEKTERRTERKTEAEPETPGRVGKTINRLIELIGRD